MNIFYETKTILQIAELLFCKKKIQVNTCIIKFIFASLYHKPKQKKSTGEVSKRIANFGKLKNETHLLFWSETDNDYRMALLENVLNIKKI